VPFRARHSLLASAAAAVCALTGTAPQTAFASTPVAKMAIVGGSTAAQGDLPFMAFVNDSAAGFACSGTVISPQIVLTAAHCAEDDNGNPVNPSGYQIVTGTTNWYNNGDGQVLGVSKVIIDPSYDRSTGDGDAALLVLSSATDAPAVALATSADDGLLASGTAAEVAGWGLTSATASTLPQVLQRAATTIQGDAYCSQHVQADGGIYDAGSVMCAIDAPSYSVGTCRGDSGGPLLAVRSNGTLVEVGVTRSGDANCSTSYPDVFTRADTLSAWVSQQIAAPTPSAVLSTVSHVAQLVGGLYSGVTGQHSNVAIQVAGATHKVTAFAVGYTLTCGSTRRRDRGTLIVRPANPWTIGAGKLRFSQNVKSNGARFTVTGVFSTSGTLTGTLKGSLRTKKYSCTTGSVPFHASLHG
jgi:secreted trypsin-like serine protease